MQRYSMKTVLFVLSIVAFLDVLSTLRIGPIDEYCTGELGCSNFSTCDKGFCECALGYIGDGYDCTDLSEVVGNNTKPCFAVNLPLQGSFTCKCNSKAPSCYAAYANCTACFNSVQKCDIIGVGCWCDEVIEVEAAEPIVQAFEDFTYDVAEYGIYGKCRTSYGVDGVGFTFESVTIGEKSYSAEKCPTNANRSLAVGTCNSCGTFNVTELSRFCNSSLNNITDYILNNPNSTLLCEALSAMEDIGQSNITNDEIEAIVRALEIITENVTIMKPIFSSIITIEGNVMEAAGSLSPTTARRFLDVLDKASAKVVIMENETIVETSNNLLVAVSNPGYLDSIGVNVMKENPDLFSRSDIEIINDISQWNRNNPQIASVFVPSSTFTAPARVSFFAFGNTNFFKKTDPGITSPVTDSSDLNSIIVASTVHENLSDKQQVYTLYELINDYGRLNVKIATCSFWLIENNQSYWSSKGCHVDVTKSNGSQLACSCDHFTSFATLFDTGGYTDIVNEVNLISTIGSLVSIVALTSTIIYYFLTRCNRNSKMFSSSFLLVQLCFNLLALNILLAITELESMKREFYDNAVSCQAIAALLHLFLLSVFAVMSCEALYMFMQFVKPLLGLKHVTNSRVVKVSLVLGQFIPIVLVAILVGVSRGNMYKRDISTLGEPLQTCWVARSHVINIVIIPTAIYFSFNCIVFFAIFIALCSRRKPEGTGKKEGLTRSNAVILVIISVTLGATWLLGYFISESFPEKTSVTIAYVFAVLNSLQGVFIFVGYVVRNKNFRDSINCFKKNNTSSTVQTHSKLKGTNDTT